MGILATLCIVDVFALCFILLNALLGFHRGLSGELARAASVIVAFIIGLAAYEPVGQWLDQQSRLDPRGAAAAAFLVTVCAAFVIMLVLRLMLKRVLEIVIAERYDRAAGLLAGTARATVIVVIVFIAMNLLPNAYLNRTFGEESVVGTFLLRHMAQLETYLQENGQERQPTGNSSREEEAD